MARQNSNISARVLDIEVFDTLNRGIKRYAKKCREIFFYPRKVIDDVNDNLNDAKLTLEVELSKASEKRKNAYWALQVAKDKRVYDEEGNSYTPDYSAEQRAYDAAVCEEEIVKQKIAELKELREQYSQIEADYKNHKIAFENYLNKDLEDASQWMKEEYQLMKDYIWQGQQLSL